MFAALAQTADAFLKISDGSVGTLATSAGEARMNEFPLPARLNLLGDQMVNHAVAKVRRKNLAGFGFHDDKAGCGRGAIAPGMDFLVEPEEAVAEARFERGLIGADVALAIAAVGVGAKDVFEGGPSSQRGFHIRRIVRPSFTALETILPCSLYRGLRSRNPGVRPKTVAR